jgi:hypothetical protein
LYLACSPTIENTCFTWRLLPFLGGRFIELGIWRKIFYFLLRLGRQLASVRRILLLIIKNFVLTFGGTSHTILIIKGRKII